MTPSSDGQTFCGEVAFGADGMALEDARASIAGALAHPRLLAHWRDGLCDACCAAIEAMDASTQTRKGKTK